MKHGFRETPYKNKYFCSDLISLQNHWESMIFFEDRAMESMEALVHPHAPRNGARRGSDMHSIIPSQDRAGTRDRGPPLCRYVASKLDITCTSKCTSGDLDPISQYVFSIENHWKRNVFACTWVAHKSRRLLTAGIAEVARACAGAHRRRATRSRSCLRASRLVRRPHDIASVTYLPVVL